MSKAVKKIDQTPESFSPKAKPEILSMVEESVGKLFRDISEIEPFQKVFEIFIMPPAIVIGKEVSLPLHGKKPLPASSHWDQIIKTEAWKTLKALPHVIKKSSCGWTCDYVSETDTFSYILSILAPAGTTVPVGFQYRNVPQTMVAVGLWGDTMNKVIERMKKMGFVTSWYDNPGLGWNTELYLSDEQENPPEKPKPNKEGCRWMVPCKMSEKS